MQKCKVITIANEKGSTGKTTTAVNIGAGLQRQGKSVLLIDFDPQANLSLCFGIEPEELQIQHIHPFAR